MEYAVVKFEMSNIIAFAVATSKDLQGNIECEVVSWHNTKLSAMNNCPKYVIDKNA
jgi:hypothetical protein